MFTTNSGSYYCSPLNELANCDSVMWKVFNDKLCKNRLKIQMLYNGYSG